MKGLGNLMKQAQEMQAKMEKMQEDLVHLEVEGSSGAGMVKVRINGKGEMLSIWLDPSLLSLDEKEILEDLIVAACNDAKQRVNDKSGEEMKRLTGGLSLPPGLKLPF
jgi:DNA-binding YbaB/EbfC family protein